MADDGRPTDSSTGMQSDAPEGSEAPVTAETGYQAGPDRTEGSTPATTAPGAVGDAAPIRAETGYAQAPGMPVGPPAVPAAPADGEQQ
jgi:hypothetical protein